MPNKVLSVWGAALVHNMPHPAYSLCGLPRSALLPFALGHCAARLDPWVIGAMSAHYPDACRLLLSMEFQDQCAIKVSTSLYLVNTKSICLRRTAGSDQPASIQSASGKKQAALCWHLFNLLQAKSRQLSAGICSICFRQKAGSNLPASTQAAASAQRAALCCLGVSRW